MTKFCPRAKSSMTPCVYRDGITCYVKGSFGEWICVGCERGPKVTGIAPPTNEQWEQWLKEAKEKER